MSASQTQNYDSSLDKVLHKRSDLHLLRKLWHITTGSLGLFAFTRSTLDQQTWGFIVLAIALCGFLVDITRARFPKINILVIRMMGPLM